ncbi:MAG TPA: hypothetical protein VKR06_15335 [Ktedonosporobacter sp.]|nr:hypothetical protein [Ktedonosporobacter sp.]
MATQATTRPTTNASLLRRTLQLDAVSTVVGGIGFLVIGESPLATMMGFSEPALLIVTGVALLAIAGLFLLLAGKPERAIVAIAINDLWVLGSIVLLILNEPPLLLGKVWIILVAAIVATFGIIEFYLWRKK